MTQTRLGKVRIILLTGEEYLRQERLYELIEATVDKATRDFNYNSFYPHDLPFPPDVRKVAEIVMSYPMISDRRVLVIRFLDDYRKDVQKKIAEVLAHAPDSSLVIIDSEKATLSPKPPAQYFRLEQFKRVYERDLPSWIRGRFVKRGKRVTESAIALLINNVGDVLLDLDNEIAKACIGVGDKQVINEEDMGRIVGPFRRHTIYALCNAVGTGDFPEAAGILRYLLDSEKNRETFYVYSLAAHVMKIAEYHAQVRAGIPRDDAEKTASGTQFLWKLNRMDEQARNFAKPETIRRVLDVLAETDSALKKSVVDKGLIVEFMLPKVMP